MAGLKTTESDKTEKILGTYRRIFWIVAILLCAAIALWVPLYNRVEPEIGGVPFFYWFQILMVVVTATVTWLAYKAGF